MDDQTQGETAGDDSGTLSTGEQSRASGRLALRKRGMPDTPLPDDITGDDFLKLIEEGGQIVVRQHPEGPPLGVALPVSHPVVKAYEHGLRDGSQSRTSTVSFQPPPAIAIGQVHVQTLHVHGLRGLEDVLTITPGPTD